MWLIIYIDNWIMVVSSYYMLLFALLIYLWRLCDTLILYLWRFYDCMALLEALWRVLMLYSYTYASLRLYRFYGQNNAIKTNWLYQRAGPCLCSLYRPYSGFLSGLIPYIFTCLSLFFLSIYYILYILDLFIACPLLIVLPVCVCLSCVIMVLCLDY